MTQEAMKLALEALRNYAWHGEACPQHPTYSKPENYPKCTCGFDKVITAIKEALAQPAQDKLAQDAFDKWWDTQPPLNKTNPCTTDSFEYWAWEGWHAALAQPEQLQLPEPRLTGKFSITVVKFKCAGCTGTWTDREDAKHHLCKDYQ